MSSGFPQDSFKHSSSGEALRAFELRSFTVRPSSHEVMHRPSGRVVRLEPRAMQVLVLLHASAGEVVTTDDLLNRVWEGKVVSPHSVATVISELRKVLAADPTLKRAIETIPKRGYRLVLPLRTAGRLPARPASRGRLLPVALSIGTIAILASGTLLWYRSGDSHGVGSSSIESSETAQYLRARQLWSRREHDATLEARRILETLIRDDAGFAPAHAALADIYVHKTGADLGLAELDTFREAQRHLDQARRLDAGLPESYVTQGLLDFYRDDQPAKALASVDQALARDRNFAYAWQTRAMLLSAMGRHAESLPAIARARAIDPSSSSIGWDEVWFLYLAGEPQRALQAFERESAKSRPNALYGALIETQLGHPRRALEYWLQRAQGRGAKLADAKAIEAAIAREDYPAAYRELLRQARADTGYDESTVVLAMWELKSGDETAARLSLESERRDRDNWLSFWIGQMPIFARPATTASTSG
jgi:DNA-binding winged helix-turn-helix (wHTH) protein